MSISFVNSSVNSSGASTSTISLTDPGAAGNFLIANISVDCDTAITVTYPDGTWHELFNDHFGTDGQSNVIAYKASGTGSGSYAFGLASTGTIFTNAMGVMFAYSGHDSATPINGTPTSAIDVNGGATPFSAIAPSITTTIDGCEIIWLVGTDFTNASSTPAVTFPGSYLHGIQEPAANANTFSMAAIASLNQATHGATGTVTGTLDTGGQLTGVAVYLVALAPSGAAPPVVIIPTQITDQFLGMPF